MFRLRSNESREIEMNAIYHIRILSTNISALSKAIFFLGKEEYKIAKSESRIIQGKTFEWKAVLNSEKRDTHHTVRNLKKITGIENVEINKLPVFN